MSQPIRTLAFVIFAGVSAVIAWGTHRTFQPVDLEAFSDVGSEFYPDFDDPNVATGLQVASYNEETGETDVFKVELENNLWRIPSHHNYPADGEERLAQTAASMVGVVRTALVERSPAAHKRYGLVDPLDKDFVGTEGRGDRITLLKGDETLVDFIVGQKLEGEEEVYYVRKADEDRFYSADLGSFEISTKFADWIEKDVLNVDQNNISELIIDRHSVDESRGVIVQGDRMQLHRESSTADWNLSDLDEAKEQLKTSDINTMLFALDDLEIVGVRPKPEGISADLKAAQAISLTTFDMIDLQNRGFFIVQGRIFSNEGELLVGTNEGVMYDLRFGEEFSGSDVELEVGSDSPATADDQDEETSTEADEGASAEQDGTEDTDPSTAEDNAEEEETEDSGLKKSRYLFVSVQFDPRLIGEPPVAPVKPEPPSEGDSAPDEDPAGEGEGSTEEDTAAEQSTDEADAETANDEPNDAQGGEEDASEANEEAAPDPQQAYEEALKRYEEDLEAYEFELKEHEQKLEDGKKRVDELNRRFADWFYVISADVFDRLKLDRTDLVEPKEEEDSDATSEPAAETPAAIPDATDPESTTDPDSPASEPTDSPQEPEQASAPDTEKSSETPDADAPMSDPATPEPSAESPPSPEPDTPAAPSAEDPEESPDPAGEGEAESAPDKGESAEDE